MPAPLPLSSRLTLHISPVPEALGTDAGLADAACPRAPPFMFPGSREEEEESLALVAIETNSLQLCCKVVRRRWGHASLSINRALPSSPHLETEPPSRPCLSDQVPPLGRERPQGVT